MLWKANCFNLLSLIGGRICLDAAPCKQFPDLGSFLQDHFCLISSRVFKVGFTSIISIVILFRWFAASLWHEFYLDAYLQVYISIRINFETLNQWLFLEACRIPKGWHIMSGLWLAQMSNWNNLLWVSSGIFMWYIFFGKFLLFLVFTFVFFFSKF